MIYYSWPLQIQNSNQAFVNPTYNVCFYFYLVDTSGAANIGIFVIDSLNIPGSMGGWWMNYPLDVFGMKPKMSY